MSKGPEVVRREELELCARTIVQRYVKSPHHRVLVGIAGRPGSGKTTVANVLAAEVRRQLLLEASAAPRDRTAELVVVMPMDGYHFYRSELRAMPNSAEAFRRRGAEWTFNPRKMASDLHAARLPAATADTPGAVLYDDVRVPSFDHAVGDPVERDICISGTAGIIIVEGNYLLYRGTPAWAEVNRCMDISVFLSCPPDICARRLCRRHMAAWGISEEAAMERVKGSDSLNGDLIDTTKPNADIVLSSIERDLSHL